MKGFGLTLCDLGGLGMLGVAIYGGIKLIQLSGISKKIDMSIREMAEKTPVDISQAMLEKATERAVDREVHKAVHDTAQRVGNELRSEIAKDVRAEVKSQRDDISAKVTKKVAEEVANINQAKLREEVAEKAEEIVLDKLQGSTNEALQKFNNGLGYITNIYNGIANAVAGNQQQRPQGLSFNITPN